MSPLATVSTWMRERPGRCVAWNRYCAARRALHESRHAFESSSNDATAAQVRWAEIEFEDAIAVAGEFHVPNATWSLV